MTTVRLYFDFISPYSYLAISAVDAFCARTGARIEFVPVVYGAILDATGLIGPAENEVKRRYTFLDVMRRAEHMELPFAGAAAHPFRSLEALRTVCLFHSDRAAGRLVQRLSHLCWGEGQPLTELAVLQRGVADVGLDPEGLGDRIAAPAVKGGLAAHTEHALQRGVFGVPTFEVDGELFWGHDRMEDLGERLDGRPPVPAERLADVLARPRGTDRKKRPIAK